MEESVRHGLQFLSRPPQDARLLPRSRGHLRRLAVIVVSFRRLLVLKTFYSLQHTILLPAGSLCGGGRRTAHKSHESVARSPSRDPRGGTLTQLARFCDDSGAT